jgi:hypothetical protein
MKPIRIMRDSRGYTFSEILVSSGIFWVIFVVIMLIVNR